MLLYIEKTKKYHKYIILPLLIYLIIFITKY